jgi:hypothetical protein
MSWRQAPSPVESLEAWRAQFGDAAPAPRAYEHRGLTALVGREPVVEGDLRWHISLRGPGRVPTWEELAASAHELRPGVVFVIGIPPRSWWVNVHPHVLHLWETSDEHLVNEFRRNRRGDKPS